MTITILDHTKYEVFHVKSGNTVSDTVLFLSSDEFGCFAVYKNSGGRVTGVSLRGLNSLESSTGFYGLRKKKVKKTIFVPVLRDRDKDVTLSMCPHFSVKDAGDAVDRYGKKEQLLGYATLTYEEDAS